MRRRYSPGFAFAFATRSLIEVMPAFGFAMIVCGVSPMLVIGAKSLSGS